MAGNAVVEGLDLVQRYLLALLGAKRAERIPEKLWLQKELFLISQLRGSLAAKTAFVPYLKGPYSEVADDALGDLVNLGLVAVGEYGRDIRLTPGGLAAVKALDASLPADLRQEIEDVKGFLNELSEEELLVFTYFTYPETVTDSVVKERVTAVRVPRSLALYRKGKVSVEKAAELAGISIPEFKKRAGGAPHSA